MPLVAAKCTNCGANIEADSSQEAGICKYCGTAFITEKAINNYNTYVTNNHNYAGAYVTVQGESENIEQLMERATTFEKLGEFQKALDVYREITDKYPMDYRGWLGIVSSKTKGNNEVVVDRCLYEEITECFDKALKVADSENQVERTQNQKQQYQNAYRNEMDRLENGRYNAYICNLYDYRDVEKAIGCKCLASDTHDFQNFTFVLGNYVECSVSYMRVAYENRGTNIERRFTLDKSTCEKNVDRSNIEELLSGYKKKSEKKSKSKGCYIATCVYGSYDCPQVWTLRRYRDDVLDGTWYGRLFIKCYYVISPVLVKRFGETKWFRSLGKLFLDRLVSNLRNKGVEDMEYQDKY